MFLYVIHHEFHVPVPFLYLVTGNPVQYAQLFLFHINLLHIVPQPGRGRLLPYDFIQGIVQFIKINRFQQVFRYPQPNGLPGVFKLAVAGNNDGVISILAYAFLQHGKAVLDRHVNIHNHNVRPVLPDFFKSVLAVHSLAHDHTASLLPVYHEHQAFAYDIFVFHNQDFIHYISSISAGRVTVTLVPLPGLLSMVMPDSGP